MHYVLTACDRRREQIEISDSRLAAFMCKETTTQSAISFFFFFWVVRFLWSVLVNVSLSFISSACSAHILAICCGMYVTSEIVWNLH